MSQFGSPQSSPKSSNSDLPHLDPADATIIADHLKVFKVLRQSVKVQVPYTGGVHPVKAEDLVLYYDVDGDKSPCRIDLGKATAEGLEELTAACQQDTLGVDQADVLGETFRKAGKMDLSIFASRLDMVAYGLVDPITPNIVQGQNADGDKVLRAELYRLNVYGQSWLVLPHKDTLRGETMIRSLVVIFHTVHAGVVLTLEHGGTTWTFDSAAQLGTAAPAPALAYAAFYGDVTHAVEPVRTGHRVTLTYNLFLSDRSARADPVHRIVPAPERAFEDTLRTLLADPAFLPAAGFLAYGFAHQYPMPNPPARQLGQRGAHIACQPAGPRAPVAERQRRTHPHDLGARGARDACEVAVQQRVLRLDHRPRCPRGRRVKYVGCQREL
ncbi:hypothetical protein B0H10DRAFT_1913063 [Mycena sp. CBHHK59/15]|nr:hypothetical protein B0H10DRAFT_1913063 [Mycena sp. CBHHK59/15]